MNGLRNLTFAKVCYTASTNPSNSDDKENQSLNESIVVKQISKKQQQIEEFQGQIEKLVKLSKGVRSQELCQEALLDITLRQQQLFILECEELESDYQKAKEHYERTLRELEQQFIDDKDLYEQAQESESKMVEQMASLRAEINEIERDCSQIEAEAQSKQSFQESMSHEFGQISEVNKVLMEEDSGFSQRNAEFNLIIQNLKATEDKMIEDSIEQEFSICLLAETPYTFLALRDVEAISKLRLQISNGKFNSFYFGLTNMNCDFDKLVTDDSGQQCLIDWKDNIQVDSYILRHFIPCYRFITRPLREDLNMAKNISNRKALAFYINLTWEDFTQVVKHSFNDLQTVANADILKIQLLTRRESLEFSDLDEFLGHSLEFPKPTEFMMVTFQLYLTDTENVEFTLINLSTSEDQIFDYILAKIMSLSAYQPGKSKKMVRGKIANQSTSLLPSSENPIALEMKFKEMIPIAEYIAQSLPITYIIYNFQTDNQKSFDPNYVQSLLKFQRQISQMKVANSKPLLKYYK